MSNIKCKKKLYKNMKKQKSCSTAKIVQQQTNFLAAQFIPVKKLRIEKWRTWGLASAVAVAVTGAVLFLKDMGAVVSRLFQLWKFRY